MISRWFNPDPDPYEIADLTVDLDIVRWEPIYDEMTQEQETE